MVLYRLRPDTVWIIFGFFFLLLKRRWTSFQVDSKKPKKKKRKSPSSIWNSRKTVTGPYLEWNRNLWDYELIIEMAMKVTVPCVLTLDNNKMLHYGCSFQVSQFFCFVFVLLISIESISLISTTGMSRIGLLYAS